MAEYEEKSISGNRSSMPLALVFAATGIMVAVLYFQGRIWWCKLGDYNIYINQAWGSSHTSQHLFDPYMFTHVLHGVLFFWLTGLLFSRLTIQWQFFIAIVAEAAWEIFENSSFIIEKYRQETASLDYTGDSIANSIGDMLACGIGFWVAYKVGWRWSIVFFLLMELFLLLWIRDNLTLNLIMLIYPFEAIKAWQIGL